MIRLKVKEIAQAQGFSQAKLARKADLDNGTVRDIFHNPYRDINLSTLDKIAQALSVNASELIESISGPEK